MSVAVKWKNLVSDVIFDETDCSEMKQNDECVCEKGSTIKKLQMCKNGKRREIYMDNGGMVQWLYNGIITYYTLPCNRCISYVKL